MRLWQNESIVVFVHPREWKKISIIRWVPVVVTSRGVTFTCQLGNGGEFYSCSASIDLNPKVFGVPTHGDYPATARIDWPSATPDLLRTGLDSDPKLLASWKSLSSSEVRSRLAFILRARRTDVIEKRQLAMLRSISV